MLNNVPDIISPKLLYILHEMGHGDEICIGDGNFPARNISARNRIEYVRLDGHGVPLILNAILTLMPLDNFISQPVKLMAKVEGDETPTPIWEEISEIISNYDTRGKNCIQYLERFSFYEHASKCFGIVATSEQAIYANVILKKGVIRK
jgi:L-fucose mutarotase